MNSITKSPIDLTKNLSKISTGKISLTHIGLAQSLFRQEKKLQKEMSHAEKLSVLNQIAMKPVREAERITISLSSVPAQAKPDYVRPISLSHIEMKFTASSELSGKIERLKGMLAHKFPSISLGELFEKLCDLGLAEWNPGKVANVDRTKTAAPRKRCVKASSKTKDPSHAEIIRTIFQKAKSRCETCGSTYAMEVDHIHPKAMGGTSQPDNLRLLCRNCNQRAAIQKFGQLKMDNYIN